MGDVRSEAWPQSATPSATPSLRRLFDDFADGVYTLAYRIVRDTHYAEDVVQETFLIALRKLHTYRATGSLHAWLYRIAYRQALTVLRKRHDVPTDPHALPEPTRAVANDVERHILAGELARRLDAAISELDPILRVAFVLRDIEGLSTTDTANALEIGESAVKMRLTRARKHLRLSLQEYL